MQMGASPENTPSAPIGAHLREGASSHALLDKRARGHDNRTMSEFSNYLLVREPMEPVLRRLTESRKSAWVLPSRAPWTVVVAATSEKLSAVPFACAVHYDYAGDHGLRARLFRDGKVCGKLKAESEVGHRSDFDATPWVDAGLFKSAQGKRLEKTLANAKWHHREIRSIFGELLGVSLPSWLSWDDLTRDEDSAYQRYPEAVLLRQGVRQSNKSGIEAALDGVEEILRAEKAAAPRRSKPRPTASASFMTSDEAREISEAFQGAPALDEPKVPLAASVDLASCTTSREWLDARKGLDVTKADATIVRELERTVRDGRFLDEGDRAAVVREAAAMLLGRWLKAAAIDRAGWLAPRMKAARTPSERDAWEIVSRVGGLTE